MINKKIVITVVVSIAGTLLLVLVILSLLTRSHVDDLLKQRLSSTLTELEKEQGRLGLRCIDVDKAILSYIDAVAPIAEKMKDGKRLSASNPIIELGEHTSDVMNTCGLFKNMLEADGDHTLSNLVLGDDAVRQEFSVIRLTISRTTASWCNSDCIGDAKKKIEESSMRLQQRLVLKK